MSSADGALQEKSRPLLSSNLWVPLLLIVAACTAVVYYGHQVAETLKQSAAANARTSGLATAHEITGFINREHERLRAFVEEKDDEIRRIVGAAEDWAAIDSLQASVKRLFRGAFAFTVTDADGEPVFEDFDGLVGPVCRSAMATFAQSIDFGRAGYEIPPIHPVPGAYHFDLVARWTLPSGEAGMFFVSMSPNRIAELIAAAEEVSGMHILLVNRDDPGLIEVTAAGARDVLKEHFRLTSDALVPGHFMADLSGTHWKLLVLPDAAALSAAVNAVYLNVAALVMALLLISAALLFVIRRAERHNSSLFMRSLQSSVSRQRAILQSMVDGMVTIDEKGTVLHVNNAVTRLFGYTSSELLGSNVRVLMPEPYRAAHDGYLKHYLDTGESKILGKGREVTARRKDGSVFPALLTLGESIEGEQRIFVGILHDMTAYNDAQRQIVAQAMAIKRTRQELDEIGQIAAKDLQMPLQRIASLGELLASERMNALSGHEKAQLKTLTAEARDLSELAKGIADYTRTEGQPAAQTVDLDGILVDVRKGLATLIANSGAEVSVDAGLGVVMGNTKQLRQVFWNLLDNALKFRDPQRQPLIRVALAPSDAASGASGDDRIDVLVSDNGLGIPADKLESVFEAFCRLHPREDYPGMGLGLSFCRKIVEGLGGQIHAESTPGEGSTFHVVLPRPGSA